MDQHQANGGNYIMRGLVVLVAALGVALGAAQAAAADLPIPQPAAAAPPVFDWSGPYVGVGIGGGAGNDHDSLTPSAALAADAFTLQGWAGDIYAGENWQIDQYVLGVEGDLTYANLSGSHPYEDSGNNGTLTLTTGWQGSLLGRAGIVEGPALIYATAGATVANATMHALGEFAGEPVDVWTSHTHVGGTIGVGIDYRVTDHLIARGAVKYTAFGPQTYDMGDSFAAPAPVQWDQTVATVGLAYKF